MRFKSEQNMILPDDEQNPGKSSTRRRQVCKRPEISLSRYRNYSCHYSSSNHIYFIMVRLFVLTAAPVNMQHILFLYNDSLIHKLQDFFFNHFNNIYIQSQDARCNRLWESLTSSYMYLLLSTDDKTFLI